MKQFRLIWLDKLVIIYFICQLLAGAANIPARQLFENRTGAIFDLVLPYFAVRMIIRDKQQYLMLLKAFVLIAAPLAILGLHESITGYNPVYFLAQYCPWRSSSDLRLPNPRSGFYRAFFSSGHPIIFGLFFVVLGPFCAGLLRLVKSGMPLYTVAVLLMAVGVFSSMSSGPWYGAILAIIFIAFFPWRKYWKLALCAIVLMCLLVEIISNRHFYEVIDRVALNSATAWYRTRLIEVALFEGGMSGHWLVGYGFADPGWGRNIDSREVTDIVNHYLIILSCFGLTGLIPFLLVLVTAGKKLLEAYLQARTTEDQWLVWCLAASMIGLLGAANSVMLTGQARILLYMLLGLCASIPTVVGRPAASH
jgi:hypothetical protein